MKGVTVYDNLFDEATKNWMYTYISRSRFVIGWEDVASIEVAHHRYLHSQYSDGDLRDLGLIQALKGPVLQQLKHLVPVKTVVNLSVPCDMHWHHTHENQTVLLYYANLQWCQEWAGETLFFKPKSREIGFASVYTPGRVIVFDGNIAHTIRPQSSGAPHYRFTVSIFFGNNTTPET